MAPQQIASAYAITQGTVNFLGIRRDEQTTTDGLIATGGGVPISCFRSFTRLLMVHLHWRVLRWRVSLISLMSSNSSRRKIADDWETQSVLWRLAARRSNPIVAFSRNGTSLPFYCVHSIAGDVHILGKLIGALGADQALSRIQVPKEKMRADFAASIETIARDRVKTVLAFQPKGPFVLGGWSTGAIIALEMTQQLTAIGRDIPLLVAFDGAPSNTGGGLSHWDTALHLEAAS